METPRSRLWLTAFGLMAIAAGLGPVLNTGGRSASAGAATAAPSTSTTAITAADDATTATSAPLETTTTAGPTTTTTEATTTTTAAPITRTAASAAPASSTQLMQVETIADSSGFDWRAAGVTIHIGYNPDACCHWGIYDYRDNSLWIGPTAFDSEVRLRYVVLHELGHAWQWASGQRGQLAADMAPWGYSGNDALEYNADCIATVWGAQMDNYWACPAAAQALVARRLAGDWS